MLVADTVLGNSYNGNDLKEKLTFAKQNNSLRRLFLSRTQMEKSHLRTVTEDGLEIGLSLEQDMFYKTAMSLKLIHI